MNATKKFNVDLDSKILLTTEELQSLLGCGRASTVKIGTEANARICIGKRVLWCREKVKKYIISISV